MDISNLAIVRAINHIPFDGKVRPISESRYLAKKATTPFAFEMNDVLRNQGMLENISDWTNEDEVARINKNNSSIQAEYLPYLSEYNSMTLWSINGLVPDDINNVFSDKDCAVVDSLEKQLEVSQVISLVPTDTAIKGETKLSSEGVIFLRKERYDSLTETDRQKLAKNGKKLEIFEGSLQEAVGNFLESSEKYTKEELSLRREDQGFKPSETREELIEAIDTIAKERNIPQVLHFNVITKQNDDVDRLHMVADEFENMQLIDEFYQKTFLKYMFNKFNVNIADEAITRGFINSTFEMRELCNFIEKRGLNEYKSYLDEYNTSLKSLQESGKLPVGQEIIDSMRAGNPIDLLEMMEKEKTTISMESVYNNALNDKISKEEITEADKNEKNINERKKEGETI